MMLMMLTMLLILSLKTADVLLKIHLLVMVTLNCMCNKLLLHMMMNCLGGQSSCSLLLVLVLVLDLVLDLVLVLVIVLELVIDNEISRWTIFVLTFTCPCTRT